MSAQVTQSVTWNHVYNKHAFNVMDEGFRDNFDLGRPLLKMLRQKSKNVAGGAEIVHRVNMGSEAQGDWVYKGSKIDFQDTDPFTRATYKMRKIVEPVIIYESDEDEARGHSDRLSLAEEKIMEARKRMARKVSRALTLTAKEKSIATNTLIECISDNGAGAIGGLDPAVDGQEPWVNQFHSSGTVWSTTALTRMRKMGNDASAGGEQEFDAVLCTQDDFETYLSIADAALAFDQTAGTRSGVKVADLGFRSAAFDKRPIFWDTDWSNNQDGKALMLNFDGIHLLEDKKYGFKLSPFRSLEVNGVLARVALLKARMQLTVSERRTQVNISAIT